MNDKKLWTVFALFIRLRDADEQGFCKCFTCGTIKRYTKMDAGHGIPRQHKATKFDEKNNQVQCKKCNGFEGGKREVFKENLDKKYGAGTWDRLEVMSRIRCKRSQLEIDGLEVYYKIQVKILREEKGL